MMNFNHFFKKGIFLFLIFAIFLILLSFIRIIPNSPKAAWIGLIIGFLNFMVGAAILCWGLQKPDKVFYGLYFGGILSRFLIIFLLLYILIKFKNYDQLLLVGSLLISYFGFLILEILNIGKFSLVKGTKHDL